MTATSHKATTAAIRVSHAGTIERAETIEGRLVYAIGDVHGCYEQLCRLLELIVQDAASRSKGRRPELVFCGDYVDRGPDSATVIEALCWLQRHCPYDLHCLKGNHEKALLDFLDDPAQATDWLSYGGKETLSSYGLTVPNLILRAEDLTRLRDDLVDQMPASHLRFLERLSLIISMGDYAFVHAGVRPTVPLQQQREKDLLWIRSEFLEYSGPQEKMIVHGHSWNSVTPELQINRIGIDTGAFKTGCLTAVRIEDGEIEFIQSS
jgi:serine/threonine protein phosphatase 1